MRLSKELFEQIRQAQVVADQMFSSEQRQILLDQIAAAQIAIQQSGAIEAANAVQAILKNTGLIEDTRPALPLPIQPEPTQPKKKRGARFAIEDEAERRAIAEEWLQVKGDESQESFVRKHNISPATLRRYIRKHFPEKDL